MLLLRSPFTYIYTVISSYRGRGFFFREEERRKGRDRESLKRESKKGGGREELKKQSATLAEV
jgi:hypothetical protein